MRPTVATLNQQTLACSLVFLVCCFLPGLFAWPVIDVSAKLPDSPVQQASVFYLLISLLPSLLTTSLFWWQLLRFVFLLWLLTFIYFRVLLIAASIASQYCLHRGFAKAAGFVAPSWVLGLGAATLWLCNLLLFPASRLAFSPWSSSPLIICVTWLLVVWVASAFMLAAGYGLYRLVRKPWLPTVLVFPLMLCLLLVALGLPWRQQPANVMATPAKPHSPNLVILRLSGVASDNREQLAHNLPYVSAQLAESHRFLNAYEAVNTSYPALIALLTGQPPAVSGMLSQWQADSDNKGEGHFSLPARLQKAGYRTVYISDNAWVKQLGSNQAMADVLAPKADAATLLLTFWLGDNPVTNLLSKTALGPYFFPHISVNRGAYFAYQPEVFQRRLKAYLSRVSAETPLFLVADIGWQYWQYVLPQTKSQYGRITDIEVKALLSKLKSKGFLDNALVVFVLGDASECSLTVGSQDEQDRLLSPSCFRRLLAFRGYGSVKTVPVDSSQLVSILDVAPTLLYEVGLPPPKALMGQVLPLDVPAFVGREMVSFTAVPDLFIRPKAEKKQPLVLEEKFFRQFRLNANGDFSKRKGVAQLEARAQTRATYDGRYLLQANYLATVNAYYYYLLDTTSQHSALLSQADLSNPDVAKLAHAYCTFYAVDSGYNLPGFCPLVGVRQP